MTAMGGKQTKIIAEKKERAPLGRKRAREWQEHTNEKNLNKRKSNKLYKIKNCQPQMADTKNVKNLHEMRSHGRWENLIWPPEVAGEWRKETSRMADEPSP
jgi:hypothetical protein